MKHFCFVCEIKMYCFVIFLVCFDSHIPNVESPHAQYWFRGQGSVTTQPRTSPGRLPWVLLFTCCSVYFWPVDHWTSKELEAQALERVIHSWQIQSKWCDFCWLSHSCWHLHQLSPNQCLTWKFTRETIDKLKYFIFPMQQLQAMQGSVWHKPHSGV